MRTTYAKQAQMGVVELDAILKEIDSIENERAMVILAASMLEYFLAWLIQVTLENVVLKQFSEDQLNLLYENYGPLGVFDQKVKFAFALTLIREEVRDDLDRIRRMRNFFAHHPGPVSFNDNDVIQECANLKMWKFSREDLEERKTAKGQFRTTVQLTLALMVVGFSKELEEWAKRFIGPDALADIPLPKVLPPQFQEPSPS
ncbi:MAG TPA: MltR family transcriptional regulator [Magnetospirillaceae bacterium]|jgi:DNA-binding MltR family transcriptional regulator